MFTIVGDSSDGDDECCPFDRVAWKDQDGTWDPKEVINRNYNPYDHRKGGPDGSRNLCQEPDCDKYEIPGEAGHGLSAWPWQKPMSSGSDEVVGNQLKAIYKFNIENPELLAEERHLIWQACIRSSAHQGNAPNAGGSLKSGGPAVPKVDACFALADMDPRWIKVDENDPRPQHLMLQLTMGGATGVQEFPSELEKIVIDNYDSRTDLCLLIHITQQGDQDHGDEDDGQPEGGYQSYEWRGGHPGTDHENEMMGGELVLSPIGRYLPSNADDDALWDWYELEAHGIEPNDEDEQLNYNSGFTITFWDDVNQEAVFPDPTVPVTVAGVRDDQQDSERGFNELAHANFPPQFHQHRLGDGIKAITEQGGLVIKKSPIHPDSQMRQPLRLKDMAAMDDLFEQASVPVG